MIGTHRDPPAGRTGRPTPDSSGAHRGTPGPTRGSLPRERLRPLMGGAGAHSLGRTGKARPREDVPALAGALSWLGPCASPWTSALASRPGLPHGCGSPVSGTVKGKHRDKSI